MPRHPQDNYPTPRHLIAQILDKIDVGKVGSFLEPCAGDGRIVDMFGARRGREVRPDVGPCDLYHCDINQGIDYLTLNAPEVDLILTNPPYSLALEFMQKALREAKTVVMLLRIDLLGSKTRYPFWSNNPPTHLFPLSKRPSFTENNKTDRYNYAWFAWDRGGFLIPYAGVHVLEPVSG